MRNTVASIVRNEAVCNTPNLLNVKFDSPRHRRRRLNLLALIAEEGGVTSLARLVGTPKSHLSAMSTGERGMGDALAAKIEEKCGKPPGWLDADPEAEPSTRVAQLVALPRDLSPVELVMRIGALLAPLDELSRENAVDALKKLEHRPEDAERIGAMFAAALSIGKRRSA